MGVNRAVKLHGIVQVDRNLTVNEKARALKFNVRGLLRSLNGIR